MANGTISDEREALAACLSRLYLGKRQVARSMTRSGWRLPEDEERLISYLRENLQGLETRTLDDFLAKNHERHPVEPDLNPDGRLLCVGDEEFRRIFEDDGGWDRFRQEFPESDGTLRFSRVGLNQDVTQALFYAGQQFDWSVGSGGYFLFSRSGGEWAETTRAGVWIS